MTLRIAWFSDSPLGHDRNGTPVWEGDRVLDGIKRKERIICGVTDPEETGGYVYFVHEQGSERGFRFDPRKCILWSCGPLHPKAVAR